MAQNISNTANRVRYVATAAQTAFVVPFEFADNAHLEVYRNGTKLTLSTQYTLTGAGNTGGGTMTLVSAAALNDDILIVRNIPKERQGDFPVSGIFDVESLNSQLDRHVMMMKDTDTRLDRRVLGLSVTDYPEDLNDLPNRAARASKILGFDADGQPSVQDANAHTHQISAVNGLQTALDNKASAIHTHLIADVSGLQSSLNSKSNTGHTHAISDVAGLQAALDNTLSVSHIHDDRYYTEAETNALLALKLDDSQASAFGLSLLDDADAATARTTLGLGSAATSASSAFAAASHAHAISDVTGLQTALDNKLDDSQATAFGLSLLDDANAAAARTTLGLGSAAVSATTDFAAASHTHSIANVTGLQTALDNKLDDTQASVFGLSLLDDADAAAARTTLGLGTAATSASTAFAAASHTHAISDVTNLQTTLDGKAASSHTHTIANVTGLQTALDNKLDDSQASAFGLSLIDDADAAAARTTLGLGTAATSASSAFATASHNHTLDSLSNVTITSLSTDQYLKWNGTAWVNAAGGGGGSGATDLDGLTDVAITSVATGHILRHNGTQFVNVLGTDHFAAASHTHTASQISDSTTAGRALLTGADAAAQRTSLGLGTAALEGAGYFAQASHTHTIANVTGLQTALDNKLDDSQATVFGLSLLDDADAAAARTTLGLGTAATQASTAFAAASHTHAISDVTNLQTTLDGKAASSHTHTIANVTGLQTALDNKLDDSQATAFGLSLLDDADAAAARTTLGLGTAATSASSAFAAASHTHTASAITDFNTAVAALAGFAKVRYKVYTNGANYTPGSEVKAIDVILTGAGGSGASSYGIASNTAAGGGGGAGGTVLFTLAGTVLTNTFTIGIGIGGAGAAAATSGTTLSPGRQGGASTFAIGAVNVATAGGGLGGAGALGPVHGAGGAGGTNTTNVTYLPAGSFISLTGGAGEISYSFYGSTTTTRRAYSAAGGASFWGRNTAVSTTTTASTGTAGTAPTLYGCGSDGSAVYGAATAGVTSAGANGVCIIKEYYV